MKPSLGIILAAGRGSRLGGLTEAIPKCLVELGGMPLLEWQLRSLRAAGISRTVVVGGYRSELIEAYGVETLLNPRWRDTNMVASLLYARDLIRGPVIVSYGDIVYGPEVVTVLAEESAHLAISHDQDWRSLWNARFDDPLLDAETFRLDANGHVVEIGGQPNSVDEIQGQFMGLIKLDDVALDWIDFFLARQAPEAVDRLDMTGLLSALAAEGRPIVAVPIAGGWCEIDSPKDLEVAEQLRVLGRLASDGSATSW